MPAVSRDTDHTDDKSAAPSRAAWILLDLVMAGAALTLAWLGRLPGEPASVWSDRWLMAIAWLAVPQALGAAAAWRAESNAPWIGRLTLGLLAGSIVGCAALWLQHGTTPLPQGVAVAQTWLLFLMALGWRSAALLRARHRRIDPGVTLVPPREPHGPIDTLRRQDTLLKLLVSRDLKLKYRGSLVGFFWSLANPLVMTATYTVAFTYIFQIRGEGFIFVLLIGILAWMFFAGSTSMATGAIVDSGSLVKSIYFPRIILPCSTVAFNLVQYALALAVLLPVMYPFYHLAPRWPVLLLPVIMALLAAFTLGVSLMIASITAVFRDVRHLLDIALQVLFWATPILYSPSSFPPQFGALLSLSPLAPFIAAGRAVLYAGVVPAAYVWFLAVLYAAASLTLGLAIFARLEERFAESV